MCVYVCVCVWIFQDVLNNRCARVNVDLLGRSDLMETSGRNSVSTAGFIGENLA